MAHSTINRETASRVATLARFAAVALALCAGAVAVLGVPGGAVVPERTAATPAPDSQPDVAEPAQPAQTFVDAGGIAIRLASVSNAPKQQTQPIDPEVTDMESTDLSELVEPPSDEIRFLGLIREPNRMLALLRVSGRQVVMWIDRTVDGLRLVEIHDEWVLVERDGVSWRLDRAPRKLAALTRIETPLPPPEPMADSFVPDDQSREAAVNALRQNRMQARDRARSMNIGPGSQGFRSNDPARPWRED